jgi:hypothetical protein
LFWEKSTAGWLLVANLFWGESTVGCWLISQVNTTSAAPFPNSSDSLFLLRERLVIQTRCFFVSGKMHVHPWYVVWCPRNYQLWSWVCIRFSVMS